MARFRCAAGAAEAVARPRHSIDRVSDGRYMLLVRVHTLGAFGPRRAETVARYLEVHALAGSNCTASIQMDSFFYTGWEVGALFRCDEDIPAAQVRQ